MRRGWRRERTTEYKSIRIVQIRAIRRRECTNRYTTEVKSRADVQL